LRQHLKHAFNKTGTHKQHELVGIVLQMQRKR
jgi:DNA-binding CsgD family transcriptional regulator